MPLGGGSSLTYITFTANDGNSALFLDRGVSYILTGQAQSGLEDLNTALKIEMENPVIFYWRGIAYT
jgi:hypothetical protein